MTGGLARLAVVGVIVLVLTGTAVALQAQGDLPPGKAAREALEAQARATARAYRSPEEEIQAKKDDPGPPTPMASFPRPVQGIVDSRSGPLPKTRFSQRNLWQGPIGDESTWLQVNAGIEVNPDGSFGSAALVLCTMDPERKGGSCQYACFDTVRAPTRTGALRILAKEGDTLRLQTDGGGTVFFDLRARQLRADRP